MAEPSALLYLHMNPPPGADDEFNAWYEHHAPARRHLPGFHSAARYQNIQGDGARYMALYDMDDLGALKTPEYLELRARERDRDWAVLGRILLYDRRAYTALDVGQPWAQPWTEYAPYVVSMTMDFPPEAQDDCYAWYLEEHIPTLMNIPGWRRIRRFELAQGAKPSFLVLHELSTLDVLQSDELKRATTTPWRDRVMRNVTRRECITFELLKGW